MSVANVGERAATARDLRKARQQRTVLRLGIGVVLPTLLAALYYGALAAPEYESVSAFTVRSADGGGGMGLEFFIASVPGSSAGADAMLVQEYIISRDMLAKLEAEHDFVSHYRDHGDFWSRLAADADAEERFEYYADHVLVEHDSTSGVITLAVRAYSAAKAALATNTKTWSQEFAPFGIRVGAVAPGMVETPMTAGMNQKARDALVAAIPVGRVGVPEDIWLAVRFVIECDYFNGRTIDVDGGLSM